MARRPLVSPTALACLFISLAAVAAPAATVDRTAILADLTVNQPVSGDVVVIGADLELGPEARIEGDAVAVGGDIRVADGAVVTRHVVTVLGRADVSRDARVGGKVLSLSSLALLGSPESARGLAFRADFPMRLLTAGGWLLVTTALAFLFPTRMRLGAWAISSLGMKVPAMGMLVGLTVVATLIAGLGLAPVLGVPLVGGLMVLFFVAKVVGLTVLGCWLGEWLLRRWVHHPLPISLEVFVGVVVLLAFRFLPVVGETLWTLISMVALGASIVVVGVSTDLPRPEASSAVR